MNNWRRTEEAFLCLLSGLKREALSLLRLEGFNTYGFVYWKDDEEEEKNEIIRFDEKFHCKNGGGLLKGWLNFNQLIIIVNMGGLNGK